MHTVVRCVGSMTGSVPAEVTTSVSLTVVVLLLGASASCISASYGQGPGTLPPPGLL